MSRKNQDESRNEGTSADALETASATASAKKEPCVSLVELIAMKKIPDHHAPALKGYVGADGEKPLSEWMNLYKEMMSKPSDVSKEKWHEEFKTKQAR